MNFGFTDEQELLRAEVRKFIEQNASLEEVRKIVERGDGFDRRLYGRMAELGWVGLTMPEACGGMGLGFVTLLVLLEETGRGLFPSPLISSVLAAHAIARFGSEAQQQRFIPGLADGSKIGALAVLEKSDDWSAAGVGCRSRRDGELTVLSGTKCFVPDAGSADFFVVAYRTGASPDAVGLAVVEATADGVTRSDLPGMDLTKRIGRLELDDVRIDGGAVLAGARDFAAVQSLIDLGAALVTAESVGAAERALEITTEFAKQRVQFESVIGRFQGVKHPLAEMFVDIESYKSLVYYAFWALDEGHPEAALAVSRAKAYASESFPAAGITGVQLHGGVGYTWEYDIQLFLKRGKWMRPMFGDADHHYDRIDQLGGL
jgi:alkylation response protein AidB-like acyl-CoA dehydrogenase